MSETPLHKAVRSNAIDNVAALLAFGSLRPKQLHIRDVAGNTALHKAAALPGTELAIWNALLSAEGDGVAAAVKKTNADGANVLHVAQRAKNSVGQAVLRAVDTST